MQLLAVSGITGSTALVLWKVTIGSMTLIVLSCSTLLSLCASQMRPARVTTKLLKSTQTSQTKLLDSTKKLCETQVKSTIGVAEMMILFEAICCYGASIWSVTTIPQSHLSVGLTDFPARRLTNDVYASGLRVTVHRAVLNRRHEMASPAESIFTLSHSFLVMYRDLCFWSLL